jgi:hypothetical protein
MSAEQKHTPGPWDAIEQHRAGPMIAHKYETGNQMHPTGLRLICHMLQRGDSLKQDQANARLIAAAPDMLAALKLAREYVVKVHGTMAFTAPEARVTYPDLQKIDAAIAKATGAQHA